MILAGEHHLHLAYVIDDPDPSWDGTTCREIGEETEDESCCLLSFRSVEQFTSYSHSVDFWTSHPLANAGLEPNALYEIVDFPIDLSSCRHYAIMFHDSMFECLALSVSYATYKSSISAVIRSAGRG